MKANCIFVRMVVNATAQKWSPKQSIPKISSEAAVHRCSSKLVFLKIFRNTHKKTPVLGSLFNKLASLQACNFIKRYSNTGVFLWNLRNFQENLFWRTSVNDCFWSSQKKHSLKIWFYHFQQGHFHFPKSCVHQERLDEIPKCFTWDSNFR